MTAVVHRSGLDHPGVLDACAYDERIGRVVLAMFATQSWEDENQGLKLQEKLNAYASFALDGEMAEQMPDLAGRALTIQLRTVYEPTERVLGFLQIVREQLEFQDIVFETVLIGEGESPAEGVGECGSGSCGCSQ
ncbi:MAG: DUF6572 domain-containing protein [Chthoniobacterales bacterium]